MRALAAESGVADDLRAAFDRSFAIPAAPAAAAAVDLIRIAIGDELLAVLASDIAGIYSDVPVTSVPSRESRFVGLGSLHDRVLSVYDLGLTLGMVSSAGRWLLVDLTRAVGLSFSQLGGHTRVDRAAIPPRAETGDAPPILNVPGVSLPLISVPAIVRSLTRHKE